MNLADRITEATTRGIYPNELCDDVREVDVTTCDDLIRSGNVRVMFWYTCGLPATYRPQRVVEMLLRLLENDNATLTNEYVRMLRKSGLHEDIVKVAAGLGVMMVVQQLSVR